MSTGLQDSRAAILLLRLSRPARRAGIADHVACAFATGALRIAKAQASIWRSLAAKWMNWKSGTLLFRALRDICAHIIERGWLAKNQVYVG